MSENETRMSTALAALRKITGRTTDENAARVDSYLEGIEIEMERIKRDRDRA